MMKNEYDEHLEMRRPGVPFRMMDFDATDPAIQRGILGSWNGDDPTSACCMVLQLVRAKLGGNNPRSRRSDILDTFPVDNNQGSIDHFLRSLRGHNVVLVK